MGKFKKGDRVHGSSGYTFDPSTGTITDVRDKTVYVEVDGQPGKEWCYRKNQLTLIKSDSATLKIEAGKFYETRDGRKVGPMRSSGRADWPFIGRQAVNEDAFYNADGTCPYLPNDDLIAEWIDEPVAKPSNDNAKPKFKVGDLIRHKTLKYEGVVKEVVDQRTVRTHWTKEGWGATDPIDCIELITPPTPTTAIVALIENGQPKPSSTPHVHASTGAAEKEAKRLAAKYKGKQFGVFTLTTTHEEAAPVYDHKWQNMAALGLKSDAIASLKAQAGITTDQARRIVYAFAA